MISKVIPFALVEQPGIRQDGPVDQPASDHRHPAGGGFDEVGVREQEGFGETGHDQATGEKVAKVGV